jgi:putative Mg2+ transporter-C (MgtC) family protein
MESKPSMAVPIDWTVISVRLGLTLVAGGVLGMERSRSGHAAGLRTTLLVMLAASVSMIQMDLLIPTNGKPPDSYAVMDVMRLPLGILTGVGFIGAGAIVRKGELVRGLTTAATLWFATVVGLCLGGGQIGLGLAADGIGFMVLWGLRWAEKRAERFQAAELRITVAQDSTSQDSLTAEGLRDRLESARFKIRSLSFKDSRSSHRRRFNCKVLWPSDQGSASIPRVVLELEALPGVVDLEWVGIGTGPN